MRARFLFAFVANSTKRLLYLNWPLMVLLTAIASIGFITLYSVAGGVWHPWAILQIQRFTLGLVVLFVVALIPLNFWYKVSIPAFVFSLFLLLLVELVGIRSMGAQRWIALGPLNFQPSELIKITLVMVLAWYYTYLDEEQVSRPFWVFVPLLLIFLAVFMVLRQPDLGTALLLIVGGISVLFFAGVRWFYFGALIVCCFGLSALVLFSRGTEWQLLKNYQYKRIDTFLAPQSDPIGAGYHILQSKIALGAGGLTGRGLLQGTQSQLNFLPEKHTDFIFTTFAEEFGFVGAVSLLLVYLLVVCFSAWPIKHNKNRFGNLLILGISTTFFLMFFVNIAMVMGLLPVVGVPLPLISYGGSSMLVIMAGFGLVQSAHINCAEQRLL